MLPKSRFYHRAITSQAKMILRFQMYQGVDIFRAAMFLTIQVHQRADRSHVKMSRRSPVW